MQTNLVPTVPLQATQRYQCHAYSVPLKISLKKIRRKLSKERLELFTERCLIWHRDQNQLVFIFKFGTAVLFNVPVVAHDGILAQLGMSSNVNPHDRQKITEDDEEEEEEEITEDDLIVVVEAGQHKVEFSSVTIPDLGVTTLQIIAELLAQSNALELIEWQVDEFLSQSEQMSLSLKERGWFRGNIRGILRFLGESLATRYRLINQLAILDEPEKTWEEERLYTLYNKLYENFDLDDRLVRIDKMLELSSDTTRLMLELHQSRRSELLEMTIVALIAVEMIIAIFFR